MELLCNYMMLESVLHNLIKIKAAIPVISILTPDNPVTIAFMGESEEHIGTLARSHIEYTRELTNVILKNKDNENYEYIMNNIKNLTDNISTILQEIKDGIDDIEEKRSDGYEPG